MRAKELISQYVTRLLHLMHDFGTVELTDLRLGIPVSVLGGTSSIPGVISKQLRHYELLRF